MALVECRRFLLPEALVARATLEAAGFHPLLFDEFRASLIWTEQLTIGGVRLMVHDQELCRRRRCSRKSTRRRPARLQLLQPEAGPGSSCSC